jgi:hypothetical protein
MIKIEATFPKRDNEGILFRTSDFEAVESYLIDAVGGYSSYDSTGGWADNGKIYVDHSVVYVVVVEECDADRISKELKNIILNRFRQISAWITHTTVTVYK